MFTQLRIKMGIIIFSVSLITFAAVQTTNMFRAVLADTQLVESAQSSIVTQASTNQPRLSLNESNAPSCMELLNESAHNCEAIEADLLASTVRIVIQSRLIETDDLSPQRLQSNGYGTVKDGRYLVTHNHFGIPIHLYDEPSVETAIRATLYSADGRQILETNFANVSVVLDENDILVFDFGEIEGMGLLAQYGLDSAEFITNAHQQLTTGAIVAQIDWNGAFAHINWAALRTIEVNLGTDYISLHSCIVGGASGGGVFWNGYHIGNNFARVRACDAEGGEQFERYSVAALNSTAILQ